MQSREATALAAVVALLGMNCAPTSNNQSKVNKPKSGPSIATSSDAFLVSTNKLLANLQWPIVSNLFDPNPGCSTEQCIAAAFIRGTACDAVNGPIVLTFEKKFYHGDGFSAQVAVGRCQFSFDVYFDYKTDQYYFPLLPKDL